MPHHRRTSTSSQDLEVHLHLEYSRPSFEDKVTFWTEKTNHLKEWLKESICVQMEKPFHNRSWGLRCFRFSQFHSCFDIFAQETRDPFTHNKLIARTPTPSPHWDPSEPTTVMGIGPLTFVSAPTTSSYVTFYHTFEIVNMNFLPAVTTKEASTEQWNVV